MIWDRISRAGKPKGDPRIRRDPLSIGVAFLVNIGYAGTITGLGATLVGSAILGAVGLGLSFLSNAIFSAPRQAQSDPQQRQSTIRQSIGARLRYYGRVKVGGTLWFFESKDGYLCQGMTLNEGLISTVREVWLNDVSVSVDPIEGYVLDTPYNPHIRLFFKYGDAEQTAEQRLIDRFPGIVTDAHRLRGIAYVTAFFQEVSSDEIGTVYPQLNPNVRIVMNASLVQNVRTGAVEWSDNPPDCIYDYLVGVDGAGFARGSGFLASQIEISTFREFATLSDQAVTLKGGGTIPRYRMWGGYALNEKMKDVLPRMLATCDGDLYLTNTGKIAMRGGRFEPPQLVLDDSLGHIISHEFGRGQGALAAFNELTTTYTEPDLDYQEVEADRWVDAANFALVGRPVTATLDLQMVPHHAQARRLAKIHTHKNNPRWQGRVVTNFYGLNAIGERMVRLKISALFIDEDFLIRRVTILPDMTGVELQVSSLSAQAYEWDAQLEEGTAPSQPPDTGTPVDLPPPEDFDVTVKERDVSGSVVGLYLEATWTEPDRTALNQQVQYRLSPGGDWFNMSVSDGIGLAESGIVNDGADYDVRIRTRSPAGANGEWSDPPITINASI